jgi:hypothetical protein
VGTAATVTPLALHGIDCSAVADHAICVMLVIFSVETYFARLRLKSIGISDHPEYSHFAIDDDSIMPMEAVASHVAKTQPAAATR